MNSESLNKRSRYNQEVTVINNEIHHLELKNGMLVGKYHPDLEDITLKIAKQLVSDRKKLCKGNSYPVFVDVSKSVTIDKESRDYFVSDEANEGLVAVAVLVKGWVQQSVVNFWYSLSKPKIPTKLFLSKEKAMIWLSQYVQEND